MAFTSVKASQGFPEKTNTPWDEQAATGGYTNGLMGAGTGITSTGAKGFRSSGYAVGGSVEAALRRF